MPPFLNNIQDSLVNSSLSFTNQFIGQFIKQNSLVIVLILLVLIVIWLLIRELRTWYWKVNKIVNLLEKIEIGVDFLAANADQNNEKKTPPVKINENNDKETV